MASKQEMFQKTFEALEKDIRELLEWDAKNLNLVSHFAVHWLDVVAKGSVIHRGDEDTNGFLGRIMPTIKSFFDKEGEKDDQILAVVTLDNNLVPMRAYAVRHESYDHDYGNVACKYLNFVPRVTISVGYKTQVQEEKPNLKAVDQRPSEGEGKTEGK